MPGAAEAAARRGFETLGLRQIRWGRYAGMEKWDFRCRSFRVEEVPLPGQSRQNCVFTY